MRRVWLLIAVLLTVTLVAGCANPIASLFGKKPAPQTDEEAVLARAQAAVAAIRDQDMTALADLVDPKSGVRFSPYAFVNTSETDGDRVFTAADLRGAVSDQTVRRWGAYDGSGEPIDLTFAKYWDRFVYNLDYASAEQIKYNAIIGQGNTLINIRDAYPNAVFVEYYIPGVDPQYGGLDWGSLRLVFQKTGNAWYLVGIVHDQWTI